MPSLIPEDLSSPGTHALVIGVSAYRHLADGSDPSPTGISFEMEQLSAAARSASEFAAWLKNEYTCARAPLKSLRVLLSPSPGELIHPDIAALLNGDTSATRPNVENVLGEFRNVCNQSPDNVLIVYIAGHGVQLTKHGAIVLLHDFGKPGHLRVLDGAIDMAGVHAGMNHPNTAQTQFWFVDACRQKPVVAHRFETLKDALTLDEPPGATQTSPLFLATVTGKEAYARVGGVTLFHEALMWILQGNAAKEPDAKMNKWHISVITLITHLPERVEALAQAEGVDQKVEIAPTIHEAVFHEFAATPKVDLKIELAPSAAKLTCVGSLKKSASIPILENFTDWPIDQPVEAGLYLLEIQTPTHPLSDILVVKPPPQPRVYNVAP